MADVAENVSETFEEQAAPAVETENVETFLEPNVVSSTEVPEIKLFGRWSCDDVTVSDISLQDYIAVKEKFARYLPHSAGRYAAKRFRKAQCPIVERLTNSLMMKGRNNGKKLMATRIVKHSFAEDVAKNPTISIPGPLKRADLFHVLDVRVMAAAEAKPSRKHSGNHFPVQGDGYRTSKLLTTPPFSSKSEGDAASNHRVHGFYSPTKAAHVPTFYRTVGIKLETDEQPNVQHHKDFAVGWAKALQAEVDVSSIQIANKTTVSGKEHRNIEEFDYRVCKNYVATEVMSNNKSVNTTKKINGMDEFHYIEDDVTDLHNFDSQVSKQGEKVSDLESHWTGTEKTKPWWQSASKDELASFVARKSLANLENCDLPQPRTKHQRKDQSTCLECFEQDCFLTSSFTETQFSGLDEYNRGMHPSVGMGKRRSIVSKVGRPRHHHSHFSISRTSNEENNPRSISNLNVGKAQLLEALCHSQTRAREAEKAAQEADTEKKHIVSLFLRQATQLFAYKQWFQLMQLENICLQLRSKEHPVTGLFSDVLPWVPCKDRQFYQPRDKRKKRGRYSRKFTMYEIAFALGLGLAGAGLLLGWTTGWLVPIF